MSLGCLGRSISLMKRGNTCVMQIKVSSRYQG